MSKIEFRDVVKRFGANEVIPRLNLSISGGDLTVFLGPSGCGKSTLLRMIAGLELPDEGSILVDGVDITGQEPRRRNVAMVFQNYALYPHLTVRENLAFPLKVAKVPKDQIAVKVTETAGLLGLTSMLDRYPKTLSGGERQRTAVGRAIIRDPKIFLFDEPLSNLDFQLRNQMRGELRSLQQKMAKTAVYVTHDQTEAMTMADSLVVLNKGAIMQIGTPTEIFHQPANLFVARFIGSPPMNIIEVEITNGACHTSIQRVALLPISAPDGKYRLGIRPDQLLASSDPAGPAMVVEHTEFHGNSTYLIGNVGNTAVTALSDYDSPVAVGQSVHLKYDAANVHLFDINTGNRILL